MEDNNKQKKFKETLVIDRSLSDDLCDAITINSRALNDQGLDMNYSFRISQDGKILFSGLPSNWVERSLKGENIKGILLKELFKCGFDIIPAELTETELKDILEFSINKIVRNLDYGQIYPFSVEKTDEGDIKIILLVYNANTFPLNLEKLPIKLRDANEKIIFADLIEFGKEVSPKKTGIFYHKINKEILKEDDMDLTSCTVAFEL
jgi:SLAP domain-containing protein